MALQVYCLKSMDIGEIEREGESPAPIELPVEKPEEVEVPELEPIPA